MPCSQEKEAEGAVARKPCRRGGAAATGGCSTAARRGGKSRVRAASAGRKGGTQIWAIPAASLPLGYSRRWLCGPVVLQAAKMEVRGEDGQWRAFDGPSILWISFLGNGKVLETEVENGK